MAKAPGLTALSAKNAPRGMHADGGGLYLNVAAGGSRSWIFRYQLGGKRREMGLGSFPALSLADARRVAAEQKTLVATGRDPIGERARAKEGERRIPTFGEIADVYVASQSVAWRNEKHRWQWRTTLATYAASLRNRPVSEIETADVLAVLKPIWLTKSETASRLRGRIEAVLDAAKAQGFRTGENPAAWRGNLKHLLPPRRKLARGHHTALPYVEVAGFIGMLRERGGVSSLAIEFIILTAARSGEALGMRWSEVDLTAKVWIVPAARMKAGREHRVPLTARALAIIEQMAALRTTDAPDAYVFPGAREGRPLSDMTLSMTMRRMKVPATVHGFRSSFRDWCGEVSDFPREIAEAALAHVVGDETERAYRRGDALEKRRAMMEGWARFVAPEHRSLSGV
ncbi:MAG: tyrosine-type recombinase/integrase [Labrys sp. (in: a-proteobacteria)]